MCFWGDYLYIVLQMYFEQFKVYLQSLLIFQSPNHDIYYFLDDASNSPLIKDFFSVGRVSGTTGDLGSLSLKKSMTEYPNNNTVFTVTVSIIPDIVHLVYIQSILLYFLQ